MSMVKCRECERDIDLDVENDGVFDKEENYICINCIEKLDPKVIDVSGEKIEIIKNLSEKGNKPFIYLDPPYYPVAKTKDGKVAPYKLYNGLDFVPVDFLKLKIRCDELTKAGIPFILSNSNCEFIRVLFREYNFIGIDEPRTMKQGKGKGSRLPDKCFLITNFKEKEDFMNGIDNMTKIMKEKK